MIANPGKYRPEALRAYLERLERPEDPPRHPPLKPVVWTLLALLLGAQTLLAVARVPVERPAIAVLRDGPYELTWVIFASGPVPPQVGHRFSARLAASPDPFTAAIAAVSASPVSPDSVFAEFGFLPTIPGSETDPVWRATARVVPRDRDVLWAYRGQTVSGKVQVGAGRLSALRSPSSADPTITPSSSEEPLHQSSAATLKSNPKNGR